MLKKSYSFLYIPKDHGNSRELSVPRALIVGAGLGAVALVAMSAFYVLGLFQGTSWLPGGSRVQKENARLAVEIVHLGGKVAQLRNNLKESYRLQELVSLAMGLDPMDPNVREAGIGGRAFKVENRKESPISATYAVALDRDLDTILRQARIQHEGYRALLDTLSRRKDVLASIPSIRPVDTGWLSSGYGHRHDPFTSNQRFHRGLDYSVPTGTPILATADGTVAKLVRERGFGMMIRLDHGNRVSTTYAHMSEWHVKSGQKVTRGQVIGLSGNTGRSTAPHLHYEVHVDLRHVNPLPYILDSYARR